MTDSDDARMRELTYRLIAMAPGPPDYPEPVTQLEPRPDGSRRSPLIWMAAAAAVILISVGVPLLFFDGDGGMAAATTTTTTQPGTPPTTAPPITETTSAPTATPCAPDTTAPPTTAPLTTDTTAAGTTDMAPPVTRPCVTDTTAVDTTAPPTTAPPTADTTTTSTTLAGESFDFFFQAGDVIAVVGVAFDDVLNVRAGPGADQPVVATLQPTADDVVATGRARLLPQSIWAEVMFTAHVEAGEVTGWASTAFLAYLGSTSDITSHVVAALGGVPKAETMLDLGRIVADLLASDEPPSRIRMSVAPFVGEIGEVTYDVIGLGDDSVYGLREHIFGRPTAGGEGFSLMIVEETMLCFRERTPEGLCV